MQSYWEMPFYLLSGLLGSGHCLGMCGGFVLAIGLHDRSSSKAFMKQLAYSLGRCFTYGAIGALMGGIGKKLSQEWAFIGNAGAILAVMGGVVICYFGIEGLTGFSLVRYVNQRILKKQPKHACVSASLFAGVFKQGGSGPLGAFIAGIATGFLPCGLLYGMLSIAAASQSVTRGAAMMVIFGIGTSPALVAFGVAGRSISLQWRGFLYKAAAISLLFAGLFTLVRGVYALESSSTKGPPKCPLCAEK
jgi:sulfite exporter TauE/SafE